MRKSLPKMPPSGLSSKRAEFPAGAASLAARLVAAGARRSAARANGAAGPLPEGNGASRVRRGSFVNDDSERFLGRLRLLEGFLSRTEISDCVQHALLWL